MQRTDATGSLKPSTKPLFTRYSNVVSFGQFTKQFAKEAVGNQLKDVMDSLRPPDAAAKAESLGGIAPGAPLAGDNLAAIIIAQVQAMQGSLKDDQELVVLCTSGLETLRVLEFYSPSPRLLVLTGIDMDRATTRIVSPVESVQLVCKVMPVLAEARPARIRFVIPKPKPA
jgi:hypothetical protein